MSNYEFEEMDALLERYMTIFKSPHLKDIFKDLRERLDRGIRIAENDIENALNGALRGSEFDGDWVGRPADDFDDDDERPIYF